MTSLEVQLFIAATFVKNLMIIVAYVEVVIVSITTSISIIVNSRLKSRPGHTIIILVASTPLYLVSTDQHMMIRPRNETECKPKILWTMP
jgi:hypothetical protein